MKLASFDIFDTALIRKCGHPECIFALLGKKLYPCDVSRREDFIVWRRHIGGTLQKSSGKQDASIAELYENADFPPYSPTELIQAELTVEAENLIVNPAIQQQIARYRRDGWTVCFASDMYLPSAFLKKILIREHCAEAGDEVFVSCELQARKDIGTLYEVIRGKFHPKCWKHFGDNLRSDVKQARKHGIMAACVSSGYTAIEDKTIRHAHLFCNNFELRLLSGLSRSARLQEGNTPEAVLAADFVAPAYLPYVFHIAEYAKSQGIRKLYFLSRDGYILKQAAEIAFPEFEMQELFVSRNSLMLPYLADDFSREAYLKIVDRNTLVSRTVSHMLWQLGLNRQTLAEQYGVEFAYERISKKEEEQDFLSKIFDSLLTPDLKKEAARQHELLIRYFQQIKLTNDAPCLLVDVGWVGTSRLMVNSILQHADYAPKKFIYFGVRSDVLPPRYGQYSSYFLEGELSTNSTILIENYYSQSPNPSVRRYREQDQDGKVVPEWEKTRCQNESASLRDNRRILQKMIRTLCEWNLSQESLYTWAKLSLDAIADLEGDIDLTPLLFAGDFETSRFVKKFSVYEIFLYLLGKRISAFDNGSICITFGKSCGRKAISFHNQTAKMFYPFYKRLFQ